MKAIWQQVYIFIAAVVFLYLTTGTGNAAIVYVPDQGFVLNADGESGEVDIGGFGNSMSFNARLNESTGAMFWGWWPTVNHFHEFVPDPETGSSPMRFDMGVEIGDGLFWSSSARRVADLAISEGAVLGSFLDAEGFLAISVYEEQFGWENEDALPTYGWIRVSHSEEDMALTVHDWAWNSTAGEPILTGQIPEPATYVMIIGLGALVFVIFRKRRRNGRG